ncbi:MAG: hypothetical protein P8X64_12660 [Anaerolineales bacterium]
MRTGHQQWTLEPHGARFWLLRGLSLSVQWGAVAGAYSLYSGWWSWRLLPWLILAAYAVAGLDRFFNLQRYGIQIDGRQINGLSGLWGRPTSIAMRSVNMDESLTTGFWQCWRGYTHIVSHDGERIVVNNFAFTRDERQRLQAVLEAYDRTLH